MPAVFSVKLPYRVRCNLPDCGKPINLVFKQEMDGMMNTFCSPYHAQIGSARWEEKKKLDIRLGVPSKENLDEYDDGNTEGGEL